ncbi:unnamed protein product [marine sediment metagenome]|uniref:Uncharacterized protein n=1 Tax=marine sediment metagenome TaxID=412755 RepID=X1N0K5_9ZZZZ
MGADKMLLIEYGKRGVYIYDLNTREPVLVDEMIRPDTSSVASGDHSVSRQMPAGPLSCSWVMLPPAETDLLPQVGPAVRLAE